MASAIAYFLAYFCQIHPNNPWIHPKYTPDTP